jgi:translocation and assembly module TamB
VAYADEVLEVRRLHTGGDFRATASGKVPMRLSMAEPFELYRDRPISARASLPQGSLAPLRRYIPGVDQLDGSVEGEVSLAGTPAAPKLSGRIDITGGSVELTGMDEKYRDITARLDLLGSSLRLTSLTTRTDDKGAASATGVMELDGLKWKRYEATVTLRDFRLVSIPDFESVQDGTLWVRSITWRDGRTIPNITGRLDVKEVEMIWEFTQTTPTTRASILMPTAAPGWVCSIDLEADNNVWIRNPDLNVEVSGTGILVRDEQGLYLRGDLEVVRGSYNVYGNKFHITDGSLNFSTAETLRPEMHINAYTPYRNEGGIEKRILLSLDWPQDKKEPTLSLSYDDPGYYESDLWRMLGGTQLASGIAANALERALNQQMSGLTVEVEQRQAVSSQTGSSPEQEMMIGVGKYLWEDFYLRFRQGLTVTSEQAIQVEYRMSKLVLLRSEFIRNSRRSALGYNSQYTDEFNLDIKFRWEY